MNNESDKLFQLRNGKYIADEKISEKMFIISENHPEAPDEDNTGFSLDESGMSELFALCYNADLRYCPEKKSWFAYDGGVWKKDAEGLIVSTKIREFVRLMTLYCSEIIDEEKRKVYLKFVSKMGDRRFRDRLMKDARDDLSINAASFDKNPYLINCLNGTYDLEHFTFREHKWDDFITMQTNFEYGLKESRFNRWDSFISEVTAQSGGMGLYIPDEPKARYLQTALGYSMLGKANEECMFILHGKTARNGKSTMLNAIEYMLGDYATVSPVSIICKNETKNADMASPTIARLKGVRFVTMAESNQYGKLDEEVIKQLTGGEEIQARNLYESPITFLPQFSLWLSCNDLPAVSDKSLFASDRIRIVEFNRHFKASERDANLKDEFKTPEAMKGIFTWLLEGYKNYVKNGLIMPKAMQKVVNQYEHDNDIVLQFLEQKCVVGTEGGVNTKVLYDAFKGWCRENGIYPISNKRFISEVTMHPDWYSRITIERGYKKFINLSIKSVDKVIKL